VLADANRVAPRINVPSITDVLNRMCRLLLRLLFGIQCCP
jgi:hypothetical protein